MLSTIELVVAGVSTSNKIALALVAGAFIVFALVCSFVLPRRNPDFPGRRMGAYVAVCVLFFVAMIAAVLIFGKEEPEASTGETTSAAATTTAAPPATTAATTTTSAPSGGGGGNATAGKAVFTSAGCSGCHTLKDAGATGNVGPNLDELKPDEQTVANQVIHGGGAMPAFKGQLTDQQIQDVAAYVASTAGS